MRLAAIFVALCMLLIAGSAGAVVYFYAGARVSEAVIVTLAVLTAFALYHTISTRLGMRSVAGPQIADLARAGADMARQLAEMGRRVAAMEARVDIAMDKTQAAIDPLSLEIDELGTLVKHLADTSAAHEASLSALTARMAAVSTRVDSLPTGSVPAVVSPAVAAASSLPESRPQPDAAGQDAAREATLAAIRAAVEANRIDLYLQPIVTLPQRKVRFYEAISRLRSERAEVLHAADFVQPAERAGLMPKIDNLVIFHCVQVVRRLLLKNRDIGVFCNVSGSTLTDSTMFAQFLDFMDANRAIAASLVLEFTQSAVRAMGPIEHESLAALAQRGFRFSLDNVTDLRIDPRELADRSFRFIKIPASLLLNSAAVSATDIHAADLSDLLARFGIDLIADKIEAEGRVVDLLDYDVRYGQGFLFSAPRPVRAEALQGIAERADVVARAADIAEERAPPVNAGGRGAESAAHAPEAGGSIGRSSGLGQLARGIVARG